MAMKFKNIQLLKNVVDDSKAKESPKNSIFRSYASMLVFLAIVIAIGIATFEIVMTVLVKTQKTTTVPYVIGMDFDDAFELLQQSNLNCVISRNQYPDIPSGRIVNQTPDAGTKVKENRKIELAVSYRGSQRRTEVNEDGDVVPQRQTYIIRYDVPNDADDNAQVKIVVYDWENRARTIINGRYFPGETILTNFVGRGPVRQEVYLNGQIDPAANRTIE